MAAATERILQSAKERIVLILLNERSLGPERLAGFAERWLRVAQSLLEEEADAVAEL
jgi:DNA-binding LacI/PurR family transcriptional regulator